MSFLRWHGPSFLAWPRRHRPQHLTSTIDGSSTNQDSRMQP